MNLYLALQVSLRRVVQEAAVNQSLIWSSDHSAPGIYSWTLNEVHTADSSARESLWLVDNFDTIQEPDPQIEEAIMPPLL
jgi:hypothetical protein